MKYDPCQKELVIKKKKTVMDMAYLPDKRGTKLSAIHGVNYIVPQD